MCGKYYHFRSCFTWRVIWLPPKGFAAVFNLALCIFNMAAGAQHAYSILIEETSSQFCLFLQSKKQEISKKYLNYKFWIKATATAWQTGAVCGDYFIFPSLICFSGASWLFVCFQLNCCSVHWEIYHLSIRQKAGLEMQPYCKLHFQLLLTLQTRSPSDLKYPAFDRNILVLVCFCKSGSYSAFLKVVFKNKHALTD